MLLAHRVAWWLTHGAVPEGMCVCHHCDNPGCVNPAHLFLGTPTDNIADMVLKDRQYRPKGENNSNAKLTEEDVRAIRREHATTTQRELARKYGVHNATISLIVRRQIWRSVK